MTTTSSAFSALAAQAATGVSSPLAGAGGAFATAGGGVTGGRAAFPLSDSPADPLAGLAGWQPAPQTQVAALPAAAVLVGGVSVADIVAVFAVAYSGAFLLNDRRGAQAAVARMTRDIAGRLQWPAAQWATAQAELSRVLSNLSASVRRGMSLPYMKEELGGAIAALHQRFAGAAPGAPAAAPAQPASGATTAPRPAAFRQAATPSPPALRPALSAQTIQSLQRMLPTQSVVKALAVAGYSPDRAPQALTSLPAMAAQYAKLQSLQSSPQWPLLARHLGPEVSAIHASLGQANGAMTRDAHQATSLMNAAEQRLHGGTLLSRGQIDGLRATAAQLQGLQTAIQNTYAALHTAGLYKANRHPVATQIATWRASLASRLDAVTQRPAAGSSPVPAAVMAASASTHLRPGVERRTAAVDTALRAIGQWGQLARQWAELPTNATPQRRMELEGLVMRAGQQLQQALVNPEVIRVMKAGSADGTGNAAAGIAGAGSASPPPNGKDPRGEDELKRRLMEAMTNAVGSSLGDLLEHLTGGAQISPERVGMGQLIAASVGFLMPASLRGPVRGSLINGAASGLETYARQKWGIDPENPAAVVASFLFSAGATGALRGLDSGPVAKWLNEPVASDKSLYAPIRTPTLVHVKDVISIREKELRALDKMGVKYSPAADRTLLFDDVNFWDKTKLKIPRGFRPDYGLVLDINELPRPGTASGPNTNAFLHPQMAGYVLKLGRMGYRLTVDTSMGSSGVGGYNVPKPKVIALSANSTWQTFVHEFQHAEFAEYLADNFRYLQGVVAEGVHVRIAMQMEPKKFGMLGEDKVNRLQLLLEKGLPELAVNETLSVDAELAVLGFRKYFPLSGSVTEAYALRHQVTELNKLIEAGDELSAAQQKALLDAKNRLMMLSGYDVLSLMGVGAGLGFGALHVEDMLSRSNENHDPDSH